MYFVLNACYEGKNNNRINIYISIYEYIQNITVSILLWSGWTEYNVIFGLPITFHYCKFMNPNTSKYILVQFFLYTIQY